MLTELLGYLSKHSKKFEENFSHSGWWKNGRPNGFGLRIYSDNSVDVGVWEDQERFYASKN